MNKTLNVFNVAAFSLTLVLSMPSMVFAAGDSEGGGTGAGNGGDAVVCRDSNGNIRSVEFFDLFEARVVRGKEIVLLPAGGTVDEKVAGAVAKIANYFPHLAKEMIDHSVTFLARAEMVSRDLVDIPDAGDIIYPSGCKIEQAIIRSDTLPYPGKDYLIDARLWNRMNADSRAAAILHEFIYGIAVDHFKHINSVNARRLNAELLSKPMPEPGALVSWAFLFQELKLGFDEPFGCLEVSPGNCGDSTQLSLYSDRDSYRVSGVLSKPMSFYFQGQLRTLDVGHFTQWKSSTEIHLSGSFLNSETFRTSNAEMKVRGGFEGNETNLKLKETEISFSELTSPSMSVKADSSCEWSVNSGSFSENAFKLNSVSSYGCTVSIEYHDENQSFSITGANPKYLSSSEATVESGILNWKYGKNIYITGITVGARGALNSYQEIGRVPELLVLGTVIKDVPISAFYFYSSAYYFASPVSIELKLREGVEVSGTMNQFEKNQPLEGKFRFTRLDGFSSEYLKQNISRIWLEDSRFFFDLEWNAMPTGKGLSYIKTAFKIHYKGAPIEISLLDAFNFYWNYWLRIPATGPPLPKGGCHTNYPTTDTRTQHMPIRIEFTKEGKRKFGTRTAVNYDSFFLKDKYQISFKSCLKKEGLVSDELEVTRR